MAKIFILEYTLFYSSIPFLVIGFIRNVLVVRIVQKTQEMHTQTNYLLVSMAASDIITILLWPLYFFVQYIGNSFASYLRSFKPV